MRTTEFPIPVTIEGTNSGTNTMRVNPGKIIGVVVYKRFVNQSDSEDKMIRASIKDASGNVISYLQHIDNYRSRDCEYLKGAKPLDIEGGQALTIDIFASDTLNDYAYFDFIFIYADPNAPADCYNN